MVNGYIKQIIQNQERKNRKHRNFFVCKNAHRGRLQKIQRYYILEEVNDMNEARFRISNPTNHN